MKPHPRPATVAALLFCSGLCALIYQTVWLREFRLIFGASTAASAAVLGIFMGGLGLGSAMLGRRAENAPKPLLFYGNLELLIAVFAALTPAMVWGVRHLYAATGGTVVLGQGMGTVIRLLMAGVVLIGPTFLMGGTLPAAIRAIASDNDPGRRRLALLYGTNTLGAVTGAAVSTFWLVEIFGNRAALWIAAGVNVIVALAAREVSRKCNNVVPTASLEEPPVNPVVESEMPAGVPMIVASSALVGFAFMVMELVWYRMLSPILGGSTFTFGLILVVALLGIGIGGIGYTLRRSDRVATLNGFAFTCAIEALFMIIPYSLGDRLAYLAMTLRSLGSLGFEAQVLGWFLVSSIVVLPASIVAGYQFPMLISLLGRGRAGVAQHTGLAYAANTVGAIVGSIAGGFGLMPLLTATGVWKLVVCMLSVLAIVAVFVSGRRAFGWRLAPVGVATLSLALVFSTGPTAVWRHAGIGAGRGGVANPSANSFRSWSHLQQRSVVWEAEGLESSVALQAQSAMSFVVNGKVDGNSRFDAGTQTMSGLLGALLHPAPKKAMIIGLGTGSTAGWLGSLVEMERVDVVELEPAILDVARLCAPVNNDVMNNPKVHTFLGDAREVLITTPERYDIVFSEPSNPYRAGIASLFTADFYEAAQQRLAPGGLFVQWLQCYEIDVDTIRTVMGTVGKSFSYVQTWRTQLNDLILIGTKEPLTIDADILLQRIATPTYKAALFNAWRVDSVEGVLSHFVANEELVNRVLASGPDISTDDRNPLEFGFARGNTGASNSLSEQLIDYCRKQRLNRPARLNGHVDFDLVEQLEPACHAVEGSQAVEIDGESPARQARRWLFAHHQRGNHSAVMKHVRESRLVPSSPIELEVMAESAVFASDPMADQLIQRLGTIYPPEANALRAAQAAMRKDWQAAADGYASAFRHWQKDPWVRPALLDTLLGNAYHVALSSEKPEIARLLFDTLGTPFAVELSRETRLKHRFALARLTDVNPVNPQVLEAIRDYGDHPDWDRVFLEQRLVAFRQLQDPGLERAARDLITFRQGEASAFESVLRSETTVPTKTSASPTQETAAN